MEAAIYFREIDVAHARIMELAERYRREDNTTQDLAALLRLLAAKGPPKNTKWSSDAVNTKEFKEEMEMYSYFIPPNFPKRLLSGHVPSNVQEKMELLRLNCRIASWVEKKKYPKILAMDR